ADLGDLLTRQQQRLLKARHFGRTLVRIDLIRRQLEVRLQVEEYLSVRDAWRGGDALHDDFGCRAIFGGHARGCEAVASVGARRVTITRVGSGGSTRIWRGPPQSAALLIGRITPGSTNCRLQRLHGLGFPKQSKTGAPA